MSRAFKNSKEVPTHILMHRLQELAEFITKGPKVILREFVMRIPAEVDYDADLVLSEAARRLKNLSAFETLGDDYNCRFVCDNKDNYIDIIDGVHGSKKPNKSQRKRCITCIRFLSDSFPDNFKSIEEKKTNEKHDLSTKE